LTESPGLFLTLLAFAAVIGPLVFVHELGHYLVARLCGVHAEVFSIGFGRELTGWRDRRGTRWRIAALPLGGYVKFAGDMNAASQSDPAWLEMPAEERARMFRAVDDKQVDRFDALSRSVVGRPGEQATLTLERGGQLREVPITIGTRIERDRFGNEYRLGMLGVMSKSSVVEPVSPFMAPVVAARQTVAIVDMMVEGLGQVITGRRSVSELGGPLKIAQISGEQAARGAADFIFFIALISINLGFINLLPIPMLDGGHLLFQGIEALQRKPVSPLVQEWAFRSGLALLLALMMLVTVNDLMSFGLFSLIG
jgi:regulator of sigma E protease